jgi:hypothetical protein
MDSLTQLLCIHPTGSGVKRKGDGFVMSRRRRGEDGRNGRGSDGKYLSEIEGDSVGGLEGGAKRKGVELLLRGVPGWCCRLATTWQQETGHRRKRGWS